MKVLIVEKDNRDGRDLSFCLKMRWPDINIITAVTSDGVIDGIENETPNLVIMDTPFDGVDVVDLIVSIRDFSLIPLIVLRKEYNDTRIANELEAGADECIVKPFSYIEFLARVNSVLRRASELGFKPEQSIELHDGLIINFTTHEVKLHEKTIRLTPTEFRLLSELAKNENRVVSHNHLLRKVWGTEYQDDHSIVKKHIHRLRLKLQDSLLTHMICNERGLGYRFVKYR